MAVAAFSEEAVTDADVDAATTAACGSSFCSSSVADADAEEWTTDVDASR